MNNLSFHKLLYIYVYSKVKFRKFATKKRAFRF